MRHVFALFAPLLLLLAPRAQQPAVPATKHPFLWQIAAEQPGGKPSYLYGTIHVPDKRIVALPQAVQDAIAACDVLYTEIEFRPEVQQELAKGARLPAGKKMQSVLPEATYQRVVDYLTSKKLPKLVLDSLADSEPWTLLALLPMLDDMKMLMGGDPLDAKIARRAKELGKATAALETPAEQLAVFAQFNHAEVAQMLDATVTMLDEFGRQGRKPIQEMIEVYLSGDLAALQKLMDDMQGLDDLKELEDRLHKSLLDDRNKVMVERLLEHRKAAPDKVHFFAVGAAHYSGEQGILALLAKAGVKVTRVGGEPPAYQAPAKADKAEAPAKTAAPVGSGK